MIRCSGCGDEHGRIGQRYCAPCHAAYMREWRKTHPLNAEQLVKRNARAYARVYETRGHLTRQPCAHCLADGVERHHPDYAKPIDVVWLCRPCHLKLHRDQASPRETPLTLADLAAKYAAPPMREAA
jgi:hypothetical protein